MKINVIAAAFAAGTLVFAAGVGEARPVRQTEREASVSPVRAHGDHYLVTADGKPFFWLGDTAWELTRALTPEEQDYYLTTRARQGYNVIQTVVTCVMDVPHVPGQDLNPFIDNDPAKPNPVFFDQVASLVERAQARGLYVALLPVWGDRLTAPWGEGPVLFTVDNLPAARAYGRFLGARLKQYPNIIWVLGGDRPTKANSNDYSRESSVAAGFAPDTDWEPIWAAMAQGLHEGTGAKRLVTYHTMGAPVGDTALDIGDAPWLDMHSQQSGHAGGRDKTAAWESALRDWALPNPKPTIDLEPNYEDHPVDPWPVWDAATGHFDDYDVRKQNYRSVFAGGVGVTYGHQSIWPFVGGKGSMQSTGREVIPAHNHGYMDWRRAMVRPGGVQMPYLRYLIESRPMLTRIPDQTMILSGQGELGQYMVATRDNNGSYAFVYFPTPNHPAVIDTSKLSGARLKGWWYDPRSGIGTPIGEMANTGRLEIKSPGLGPDWVLVLDDASKTFAPPGIGRPE